MQLPCRFYSRKTGVQGLWMLSGLRALIWLPLANFITLLLNGSGITKKKQFTLIQFLLLFFFSLLFFRAMVNSSNQQNRTQNETSFQWLSQSECIAWLTVLMTESVAMVTLNILTIIFFYKKSQSS